MLMGFADLSLIDIAAEYQLPVETVMQLCDRFQIAYKDPQTNLALEDAKLVLTAIHEQQQTPKA